MRALVWLILPTLALSGALGAPLGHGVIPFEQVRREHFDAIAVSRDTAETASDGRLFLRIERVGDATDFDLSAALEWLDRNARVVVIDADGGAPLFLTRSDLAATSGRATLGATVKEGMAIEAHDPDIAACVAAHEMLHFVGLKHVNDPRNIMYPHCRKGFLAQAIIEPWQLDELHTLQRLQATTPFGVRTWVAHS